MDPDRIDREPEYFCLLFEEFLWEDINADSISKL